jgi:hypothetical protein
MYILELILSAFLFSAKTKIKFIFVFEKMSSEFLELLKLLSELECPDSGGPLQIIYDYLDIGIAIELSVYDNEKALTFFKKYNSKFGDLLPLLVDKAIENNNIEILRYFFEDKTLFQKHDLSASTALNIAIDEGNLDVVRYLVEEENVKMDCNSILAVYRKGNEEILEYFTQMKTYRTECFIDAAKKACSEGDIEMLKSLVRRRNDIDIDNIRDELIEVTGNDNEEIRKYLSSRSDKDEAKE